VRPMSQPWEISRTMSEANLVLLFPWC
jgi:hypothetical protein